MTGVILYKFDGFLTIFGDTLLSAKVALRPFEPPSIGNIGTFSATHIPAGLCQKIVNIAPNVAYIWAGSLNEISKIHAKLTKILAKLNSKWMNDDYVSKIDKLLSDSRLNDCSIAVILRTSSDRIIVLNYGMDVINMPPFELVLTGGSGAGSFIEELVKLDFRMPEKLQLIGVDKRESDRIVRYELMESVLQAKMLFRSFENVDTGGVVESILFMEDHISKPPVTIFLIWDDYIGSQVDNCFYDHPFLVVKRFYEDGILHVSYTNYAARVVKSYTIGHPGAPEPTPLQDFRRFDPTVEKPTQVRCIYFRSDGTTSHFAESPDVYQEHFSFSEELQILQCSGWYLNDTSSRYAEDKDHRYPKW